MNITLRPKNYEFTKQCKNSPRWPAKTPSHLRTRTQINLSKLKFSLDYDQQVINNDKTPSHSITNIGFAVVSNKKSSSLPICEIKEIKINKNSVKNRKYMQKNSKKAYFTSEKLDCTGVKLNLGKNLQGMPINSRIHSFRGILNEIIASPLSQKGKTGRIFQFNNTLNKILQKNSDSMVFNTKKSETTVSTIQNCACIQTDEIEDPDIITLI